MVSVEQRAEVRRMGLVDGLGIREIRRRTGLHRETIRRALSSSTPPSYSRQGRGSKLDPFKDLVHGLLRGDPGIESQRIRELLIGQGFGGGRTIVDDYVREVRPFFCDQRTFQRTVYRLGDVMQFDLWQPKREIAVGYSQTRKAYVVVGVLGYSRFGAGALVFSKEAPDVLWGMRRCVLRTGARPSRTRRSRCGSTSTATNGPNSRPSGRGSASRRWTTACILRGPAGARGDLPQPVRQRCARVL